MSRADKNKKTTTKSKSTIKAKDKANAKAKSSASKSSVLKTSLPRTSSRSSLDTFLEFAGSFCSISPAPASTGSNESILSADSTDNVNEDDNLVRLNVYGLVAVNKVIKYTGLGIYHSGVQVYGSEWAYGGYPKPVPSIYRMRKPRDLASLSDIDGKFRFKETIELDRTKFSYDEVKTILINFGKKGWIGTNYHLLNRNCNNFSNELCKILCNRSIPPWVNRVATIFSKFPFLIRMLPDEYFTPLALQTRLKKEQDGKSKVHRITSQQKQKYIARPKSAASVVSRKSNDSANLSRSSRLASGQTLRSNASNADETSDREIQGKSTVESDECTLDKGNDDSTASVTSLEPSNSEEKKSDEKKLKRKAMKMTDGA